MYRGLEFTKVTYTLRLKMLRVLRKRELSNGSKYNRMDKNMIEKGRSEQNRNII